MPRLPEVTRDQLSPDEQAIYDGIAASRGSVRGPFAALMHSPDVAGRAAHVGTYVRFETTVPRLPLELAILVIARHWDATTSGTPTRSRPRTWAPARRPSRPSATAPRRRA